MLDTYTHARVRKIHSDYTLPSKRLVRRKRTMTTLFSAFGEQLIEKLPKQFRLISVDPLAQQTVVHRRGKLADVLACALRLPLLYALMVYNGTIG